MQVKHLGGARKGPTGVEEDMQGIDRFLRLLAAPAVEWLEPRAPGETPLTACTGHDGDPKLYSSGMTADMAPRRDDSPA
jgi:hypothetical protein